jgi:hypothetical protein
VTRYPVGGILPAGGKVAEGQIRNPKPEIKRLCLTVNHFSIKVAYVNIVLTKVKFHLLVTHERSRLAHV